MRKPASGTYCLFMTDSTARQLGYRLLVGSELELLAVTNNQESDAHIRWQNTNPWEALGGIGKPGQWSAGNTLTSVGAVLLAGALLTTGAAVIAS